MKLPRELEQFQSVPVKLTIFRKAGIKSVLEDSLRARTLKNKMASYMINTIAKGTQRKLGRILTA